MTAREHNKLLSIFYFVMAGLQLFGGIIVALVYGVIGGVALTSGTRQEDQIMGGVFLGMAVVVGLIILVFGGLTLLTAFKVLKEKPIGRTLGIIVSILSLFSIPLGTALGIYGLWFFFGDMGKNLYAGVNAPSPYQPQPPSPGTWQ
jgi:hypothetical protein